MEKLENMSETLQHVKNMVRLSVEVLMGGSGTALRVENSEGEAIFEDFFSEFFGQRDSMSR